MPDFTLATFFFVIAIPLMIAFTLLRLCPKYGIKKNEAYISMGLISFFSAYGAHWGHLIVFPPSTVRSWFFLDGGFNSTGAIVFGTIATIVCASIYKKNLWVVLAMSLDAAVVGLWSIRAGCALKSEHLGAITNVGWAAIDHSGNLRHDLGLYEFIFLSVTLLPYVVIASKKKPRPVQSISIIVFCYGAFRITNWFFFGV